MERITNLGMDPDPIDAVLVSGAKRPFQCPFRQPRPEDHKRILSK